MYAHSQVLCNTLPPEADEHDESDEEANHGDGDTYDGDETQGQGRAVSLETIQFGTTVAVGIFINL